MSFYRTTSAGAKPFEGVRPQVVRADPIPFTSSLAAAIEYFRALPRLRFLAVVDAHGAPIGAIREQVVRDLLFSPFGHALLANPGCPWTLQQMVEPCPIADIGTPIDVLIAAYSHAQDAEGLILTDGDAYVGLLPSGALLTLAAERDRHQHEQEVQWAVALTRAADAFRADALSFGGELGEATAEMQATADKLAERASTNSKQAAIVATASKQSADAIAELAAASIELARQGGWIEERAAQAAVSIDDVVTHATRGAENARSLATATDQIDNLVAMISEIAKQVGLLALNARIEAARAGPAGAAFAVVASEVKTLAVRAGSVAGEVESRTRAIRSAVAANAEANLAIESIVHTVADAAQDIRAAVLEQSSATTQIADNVAECARASEQISGHIGEVRERAELAGEMALRLDKVAERLGTRATALRDAIDRFLAQVDAKTEGGRIALSLKGRAGGPSTAQRAVHQRTGSGRKA